MGREGRGKYRNLLIEGTGTKGRKIWRSDGRNRAGSGAGFLEKSGPDPDPIAKIEILFY